MTESARAGTAGDHTAVSNLPETAAADAVIEPVSSPPGDGRDAAHAETRADGTEAVAGYQRRNIAESTTRLGQALKVPDLSRLRDISEASLGRNGQVETVFPPEDRVPVPNPAASPWRMNCQLLITAADNSQWLGNGWMSGPHTVMTAGHTVFIRNSGAPGRDGWVKRIQVMPGRSGSSLPYGSATSTSFRSVRGWTLAGDPVANYGAIILATNLGNSTGWYGFGVYTDAELLATVGNIVGYPADKPGQWYDSKKVAAVTPTQVFYTIDTFAESGCAVYRIINGSRFAFAINNQEGPVVNAGKRITHAVFDNMTAWKA